jgi:hypothetical protein
MKKNDRRRRESGGGRDGFAAAGRIDGKCASMPTSRGRRRTDDDDAYDDDRKSSPPPVDGGGGERNDRRRHHRTRRELGRRRRRDGEIRRAECRYRPDDEDRGMIYGGGIPPSRDDDAFHRGEDDGPHRGVAYDAKGSSGGGGGGRGGRGGRKTPVSQGVASGSNRGRYNARRRLHHHHHDHRDVGEAKAKKCVRDRPGDNIGRAPARLGSVPSHENNDRGRRRGEGCHGIPSGRRSRTMPPHHPAAVDDDCPKRPPRVFGSLASYRDAFFDEIAQMSIMNSIVETRYDCPLPLKVSKKNDA